MGLTSNFSCIFSAFLCKKWGGSSPIHAENQHFCAENRGGASLIFAENQRCFSGNIGPSFFSLTENQHFQFSEQLFGLSRTFTYGPFSVRTVNTLIEKIRRQEGKSSREPVNHHSTRMMKNTYSSFSLWKITIQKEMQTSSV